MQVCREEKNSGNVGQQYSTHEWFFHTFYKLLGIGCYDLSVCYFLLLLFLVFLIVVDVTQIQKFIYSY